MDKEEGTKQGVVTWMIWEKQGGFRVPDAMEIEWREASGRVTTGEISMKDNWAVIKRGQEANSKEDNCMRLSSQPRERTDDA